MFNLLPESSTTMGVFLTIVLIILVVFLCLCLLHLIIAKDAADRMLTVNMLGGITIPIIVVLSLLLEESFLLDVALVYALISFLAVIILSQVFIGVYKKRHKIEELEELAKQVSEKEEDKK